MYNYLENIKELYPKAQDKIKEFEKFYELNKDGLLNSNNFKVHDVNWYIYKDMENDFPLTYEANKNNHDDNGIFEWFCNSEFEFFKNENNLDVLQYVGRTSTFYFVPEELQKYDTFAYNIYKNVDDFISEIFYYILSDNYGTYLTLSDKNNIIFDYNSEMVNVEDIFEEIENELVTLIEFDIIKFYEECLQVYTNLKTFKDNQVEIFKSYCENEEEQQREEKEKEDNKTSLIVKALTFYKLNNNLEEKEKVLINTIIDEL